MFDFETIMIKSSVMAQRIVAKFARVSGAKINSALKLPAFAV